MIEALLKYEFLQNAFFSGMIIGIIAPLLGVFIVVTSIVFNCGCIIHVTLAGIAGSLIFKSIVCWLSNIKSNLFRHCCIGWWFDFN